jgi:hypothetical protein
LRLAYFITDLWTPQFKHFQSHYFYHSPIMKVNILFSTKDILSIINKWSLSLISIKASCS